MPGCTLPFSTSGRPCKARGTEIHGLKLFPVQIPLSLSVHNREMEVIAIEHGQQAMPAGGEPLAREFHASRLGIPQVPKPPHLAARGGVCFERQRLKVNLGVEAQCGASRRAHVAALARGQEVLIERVRQLDIPILDAGPLAGFLRVCATDSLGNRIELLQARPEAR